MPGRQLSKNQKINRYIGIARPGRDSLTNRSVNKARRPRTHVPLLYDPAHARPLDHRRVAGVAAPPDGTPADEWGRLHDFLALFRRNGSGAAEGAG